MLRIGILGSRGIPNQYGGFEQLAQHLSRGLTTKGYEVFVYNPHDHPFKLKKWDDVNIIHCFNPERFMGVAGQFIYDLTCTLDVRKRNFDVLLVLGYTSSSVWGWLYPKQTVCINHMDGIEWKRKKYGILTRWFLQLAERLAVQFSRHYISDSLPIQAYLSGKYNIRSTYIAYGADISELAESRGKENGVLDNGYYLLIARMEKENNIEMILDGMHACQSTHSFRVVGGTGTSFGKKLVKKYKNDKRIHFMGGIFDTGETEKLKTGCTLYFHGHSVGGTNPSLLEAMACGAIICAHDNVYNRSVLGEDAFYFNSADKVRYLLEVKMSAEQLGKMRENNLAKIKANYQWAGIIDSYSNLFQNSYNQVADEKRIAYC